MKVNIPVSQIFLTLKEGAVIEDFPIYMKSIELFKKLTTKYTLYDDKMANTLMKQYPEFYNMWQNVPYAIMKVDILRFIILYHYGGIVSDLDIFPNHITDLRTAIDSTVNADKFVVFTPFTNFNYETLYTKKHNPLCLDFIRYVKTQIEEKSKMKIYDTWRARFVVQTSGQKSFKRFLDKYHKGDPDVVKIEVGTILTKKDLTIMKSHIHRFPFVGLQTTEWLNSVGRKEVYSHKDKAREELMMMFK